jgi:uncharacterized membrane protein
MTTIIETLRHPKVFGIAVLDLAGTGAIAGAFSVVFSKSFILTFSVLMAVAIIVHYALGVPTQLNYYIHLNDRVR